MHRKIVAVYVFDRVWLYYAFSVSACWGIVFVRSHSESACVYMCRFVYKCVSLCVCHCAVCVTESPVMVCAQVCLLMAPKWLSVWSSTSPVGKSEGSIAEHEQCHRCFTFEHAWITFWLSQNADSHKNRVQNLYIPLIFLTRLLPCMASGIYWHTIWIIRFFYVI